MSALRREIDRDVAFQLLKVIDNCPLESLKEFANNNSSIRRLEDVSPKSSDETKEYYYCFQNTNRDLFDARLLCNAGNYAKFDTPDDYIASQLGEKYLEIFRK